MKLKIYHLWEDADESDLKYTEVEVNGNYFEYTHIPKEQDDYFENTRRFFTYTKDIRFEKMFKTIKPNYFFEIFHAAVYEGNDESSVAGLSGYAHLSLFQKNYLDWNNNKHWLQHPSKWLGTILNIIMKIIKIVKTLINL